MGFTVDIGRKQIIPKKEEYTTALANLKIIPN
jgi:hypothetical protein